MEEVRPSKSLTVIALVFSLASLLFISPTLRAQAAAPQVIITWHSGQSYIPSSYAGKALPGEASLIKASLEILSAGKPADLSGLPIYWYLNNNLVASGSGKQSASFKSLNAGQIMLLRVQVPNYPGGGIIKTIRIPVVSPKAVIVAPYPNNNFSLPPVHLAVVPYYFSVLSPANLLFSWTVNGVTENTPENPSSADVSLPQGTPSGSTVAVSVDVANSLDSTNANASLNLTYAR